MAGIRFYGTATLGSKGQIVIPVEARKSLQLEEGDKVLVIGSKDSKGLTIVRPEVIENYLSDMQQSMASLAKISKSPVSKNKS